MATRRKKRRSRLTPEQRKARKIQRDHRKEIRAIFTTTGFERIDSVSEKEFTYQGTTTDFDDLFVYKNIVALIEYTTAQESAISDHLKRKKVLYDKILEDQTSFVNFLDDTYREFRRRRSQDFSASQIKIVIVYCSVNAVKPSLKHEVQAPKYLDFRIAKYFKAVTSAIKLSGKYEFFYFPGFRRNDVGQDFLSPNIGGQELYAGSILPEEASHFRKGYKVVSFYVDPESLLSRSYVLRQDRWEEPSNLYQRMISKKKIEAVRKYLLEDKRVFINNIIVTLPSETEVLDTDGRILDLSRVVKTSPVKIRLPSEYNSVGLVDGQHRVYSYYEGGLNEEKIRKLRVQQNLLATGIIYPESVSQSEKTKFEAKLFLEINANQTNAKSDVKQAIGLLLNPFSADSIAKDVVNRLNDQGPLSDQFERYFFEKGRLKTTSVVSYGIRHVVKLGGNDSLFETWPNRKKSRLSNQKDVSLRDEYVRYCVQQINLFLAAVKAVLPKEKWTPDKKSKGMLTTTNINGFIVCLRKVIEHGNVHKFQYYQKKLANLQDFQFGEYHSSQYGRMGEELYNNYFGRSRT